MLTNWLQRAGGYMEGADVPVEDIIPVAAMCLRVGVVIAPIDFLALSENEREALALAQQAIDLDADEETWADRARAEFVEGLKDA
jgi:hypothetical protein